MRLTKTISMGMTVAVAALLALSLPAKAQDDATILAAAAGAPRPGSKPGSEVSDHAPGTNATTAAPAPAPAAPPAAAPVVPAAEVATTASRPHPIILSKAITDAIEAKSATMDNNFENSAPTEQQIHMTVGRTIFIDTKHRLTRVYVTDPTVLNSYTPSPNQVVLTALKTGTSTLLVWDENGASQSYMVSADLDLDSLSKVMKDAFPAESIDVHASEGRVLLTGYVGTQASYDAAQKMAEQYSKDVSNSLVINSSRVKQVRLKVRIVELDRSKLAQFGFNFFSAGGNNLASTTTGAFPSTLTATAAGAGAGSTVGNKNVTISNPLNFSLYNSKLNIGATLQDLASMNIAQILAEPTITTMSGQKANFLAGGEFPFPVVQSAAPGQAASVTIMFKSYGVKVEFTPRVNSDGTIDLKVMPEVSALDFSNAVSIAGYTIPAISTRRADTEMVLQNGQSFAISGLLDQRTQDTLAKTPGIANIPILGELFKSKNTNHSITELIVIVTPEIVDPLVQPNVAAPIAPPVVTDPGHPGEVEPGMVVPKIDPDKFNKELPKRELKQ